MFYTCFVGTFDETFINQQERMMTCLEAIQASLSTMVELKKEKLRLLSAQKVSDLMSDTELLHVYES